MTTIVCTSDLHICSTSPRWAECQRVLGWIADYVCREDVDAVLVCGDVYDRLSGSNATERSFAAQWLLRLASACPVVIVRGNHDVPRDLSIFAALEASHPISVAEHPEVLVVAGVVVPCLPWPRLAELAARTGDSGLALEERASEALRAILRGLEVEARRAREYGDQPVVLATHALITGALTSHGQPLVGGEMHVGLADLALACADVVVAGHIHKPQAWEWGGVEEAVLYCGSPFRTAFGEHESKSIVRLTLTALETRVERVETPAQRMIDVSGRWEGGDLHADVLPDVDGHHVRLRYTVLAEHREAARAEADRLRAQWLASGAQRVVIEAEVVATSTARAPEIARATTTRAQLEALWRVRGDVPSDVDGVLSALAEIEEAA